MDSLPESMLLEILSRLDDLADVASCRVASKAFNSVFPGLRSIHLPCSMEWHRRMRWQRRCRYSRIQPFKEVFVDLVSKLKTVESVCIGHENPFHSRPLEVDRESNDFNFTDGDFAKEWLPRVSDSLKSLSIFDHGNRHQMNVLPMISAYCHNLVNLNLKFAWLSMEDLKPMLLLTSLTLEAVILEDENLEVLNKCFPNLQVLNMLSVSGLKNPKIHLLKLKACDWDQRIVSTSSLTLITPNLITLKINCHQLDAVHIEAPMLTHFDLTIFSFESAHTLTFKKFESLKTLLLDSLYMGSLLSKFLITKSLENLTLDAGFCKPIDTGDSKLSLAKVFKVFPNVSSLRISYLVWLELEDRSDPKDWEIFDGGKGLKTFCASLMLLDTSLTFTCVGYVLDQCVSLSNVSLLIYGGVVGSASKSFMSRCMARWPGLKWRWGINNGKDDEDSWLSNDISN